MLEIIYSGIFEFASFLWVESKFELDLFVKISGKKAKSVNRVECVQLELHHGGQRGLAAPGEQPQKHHFQQKIALRIFTEQIQKFEGNVENAKG